MSEKKVVKPVALAVGAALAGTFAISGTVNAADTTVSPFQLSTLQIGYMLGEGEGSCGASDDKDAEGSCGEGSCGADKEDKKGEGSCGADKEGEGSCGGHDDDKKGEGSCGGSA